MSSTRRGSHGARGRRSLQLPSGAQFQDAADTTYAIAGQDFGSGSSQQQAVPDAWSQVGVKVSGVRAARRSNAATRPYVDPVGNGLAQQIERLSADLRKLSELVKEGATGKDFQPKEYAGKK